jgi:hypothetical protein
MKTNRTNWLPTTTATAMALLRAALARGRRARSTETSVTRRVVVSIPDRKLALFESDRVVSINRWQSARRSRPASSPPSASSTACRIAANVPSVHRGTDETACVVRVRYFLWKFGAGDPT